MKILTTDIQYDPIFSQVHVQAKELRNDLGFWWWVYNIFIGAPSIIDIMRTAYNINLSIFLQKCLIPYRKIIESLEFFRPFFSDIYNFLGSLFGIEIQLGSVWKESFIFCIVIFGSINRLIYMSGCKKTFFVYVIFSTIFTLMFIYIVGGGFIFSGNNIFLVPVFFGILIYSVVYSLHLAEPHCRGLSHQPYIGPWGKSLFFFGGLLGLILLTIAASSSVAAIERAILLSIITVISLLPFAHCGFNYCRIGTTIIGGQLLAAVVVIIDQISMVFLG